MPIYEYRCEKGHSFEVMQRMADDTLTECTVCRAPVQRVFHPVAVHFKGKGFYTTDYGKGGGAPASSDGKPDSGSDSGDSSKSDSKKTDSDSGSAKKDGSATKKSETKAAKD